MPAPLAVDREQVRMLAMELGPREAARRCNLKEDTVLQWSKRGNWLAHLREPDLMKPVSMQKTPVIGVISPSDALANLLKENKKRTKIALSSYLGDASEELKDVPNKLEYTDAALQLATMAGKVYPEDHQEAAVSLQFFSIVQDRTEIEQNSPIYDISSPSGDISEENPAEAHDSLDDPMF